MLSISIHHGSKLSYAMRALSPMLGSNSRQAKTALSQVLGHDGASRRTLLSKMLRHNSTRAQNHSDTSIGLRQRSCAAACGMLLWKNHGSHFITIKSIGKTYYPVPLRFAVNGSASARSASTLPTLATPGRQRRQHPPKPCSTASTPATARNAGAPGRRESLATFCGERFGDHSRQRRRCPLNGAPSKRAPSRRWAASWQNIALMHSRRSLGR